MLNHENGVKSARSKSAPRFASLDPEYWNQLTLFLRCLLIWSESASTCKKCFFCKSSLQATRKMSITNAESCTPYLSRPGTKMFVLLHLLLFCSFLPAIFSPGCSTASLKIRIYTAKAVIFSAATWSDGLCFTVFTRCLASPLLMASCLVKNK